MVNMVQIYNYGYTIWVARSEAWTMRTDSYSSYACAKSHLGIGTPLVHSIDLFDVIVFIRATDHVITMLCKRDQKLWMAKTFPVPLILMDSSQIFSWKIYDFWFIFNRQFYLVF